MLNDLETLNQSTPTTSTELISFAEGSHARTCPGRERARALLATARDCGLNLPGLSGTSDRNGSWLKTSPAEPENGLIPSDQIWDGSVMRAFRSRSLARLLEHLTNEPGCLSWPTVTAARYGTGNNGDPGDGRGTYRTAGKPSLWTLARQWPTVVVTDRASTGRASTLASEGSTMKPGRSLTDAMRLWLKLLDPRTKRERKGPPVELWPTPVKTGAFYAVANNAPSDLPAPVTSTGGINTSEPVVLSPEFCGALMGFPPGWLELGSEQSETVSIPKSRKRSDT